MADPFLVERLVADLVKRERRALEFERLILRTIRHLHSDRPEYEAAVRGLARDYLDLLTARGAPLTDGDGSEMRGTHAP